MSPMHRSLAAALCALALCLAAGPACAHTQAGVIGGFLSGFSHPIFGPDHLVAMVAVGLWGAQLGNPGIWVLPITFPLVMAFGGLLGVAGVPFPAVEPVVAASAIVLGLVVALRVRAPFGLAAILVAIFAVFHGYAHGRELPAAADPVAYGVGFVLATGLLHLSGILTGLVIAWPIGERFVRACGVAIAGLGCWFLWSQLGAGA